MKNNPFIFCILSFTSLFSFPSQASSENQVVSNFLAHVGIELGSDVPVSTNWSPSESIVVSNDVLSISYESHERPYYGSISTTNNVPVGTFEINISKSELSARMFWGVRQTCRPLPPNLYYDSYSIEDDNRGFLSVWETFVDDMNVTNRIPNHVCLLFQNISIDVESDQYSPEAIALALLSSGGVVIPEEVQ